MQASMITMGSEIFMLPFQRAYPMTCFGWKKNVGYLKGFSEKEQRRRMLVGERLVQENQCIYVGASYQFLLDYLLSKKREDLSTEDLVVFTFCLVSIG